MTSAGTSGTPRKIEDDEQLKRKRPRRKGERKIRKRNRETEKGECLDEDLCLDGCVQVPYRKIVLVFFSIYF